MLRNFLLTSLILLLGGGILYITVSKLDPFGEQSLIAYAAFFISLFATITALFTFVFSFYPNYSLDENKDIQLSTQPFEEAA